MRRHPADLLSFAFGVVFLACGALLFSDHLHALSNLQWAGPAVLIVVALAMFASLWRPSRSVAAPDARPAQSEATSEED